MRRMGVPVALAAAGWMLGCAADVDRPGDVALPEEGGAPPAAEGPVGLFTLRTEVGPVDVISFRDASDGVRRLRVHRVTPIGDHETSEIRVIAAADPAGGNTGSVSYALFRRGVESCRLTRRVSEGAESGIDVDLRLEGETLTLRATRAEGGALLEATVIRGGTRRVYTRFLDRRRAAEPGYAAGIRDEIRSFYPEGPLAGSEDLRTLYAVVGSADWGNHLVTAGDAGGGTPDPNFVRRMRVGCVIAAVSAKISCFAARFTPYAWLPCIAAEGVTLACLTYNIQQIVNQDREGDAPPPSSDPCGCPCGCD